MSSGYSTVVAGARCGWPIFDYREAFVFPPRQHAVLVRTAEIKPHDALRMSQLRKLSRLVSHLLNHTRSITCRIGQFAP
jgi:hypothetical protein